MTPGDVPRPADSAEQRLRGGDLTVAGELFESHRARLRRVVQLRLDRRLQGRLDPSDVLQEAYLDWQKKLAEVPSPPEMPLFLWLRLILTERLLQVHRQHLGTQMRDVRLEVSLYQGRALPADTQSLAQFLLGRVSSPSAEAIRTERRLRLQEALNQMDHLDREVLALRHFEELSNSEIAAVLGLTKQAASNRYVRALKRLKDILQTLS